MRWLKTPNIYTHKIERDKHQLNKKNGTKNMKKKLLR